VVWLASHQLPDIWRMWLSAGEGEFFSRPD
jgi:hypothetical protein